LKLGRFVFILGCFLCAVDSGAATTLHGKVVGITDGDTLTLLVDHTQHEIRLAQIDAPEGGQPWGSSSKQALADKVFQKNVRVEVIDIDRYGREVGTVWLDGRNINRELIRSGDAWVYRQYLTDESLLSDEQTARAGRAGLWDLPDPVAPWDWRHRKRSFSQFDGAGAAMDAPTASPAVPAQFQCGSKVYCREMASCEEALFYLKNCGARHIDGDLDGVPCEALCGH
jgi:endonuclease YncB( thermonuclease family)